ncbi:pyruvate dehydrogenase complex dihydrolipoamide acetyltransferase [Mesorhizobium sp.]|uniref:pyruvate dehydrogenase complex dihydrolipoamide acetyltransferase n=3 Tax=Mesorhizobium sp. TaxID=1871066 RepID=UPI000FE6F9B1|nr:pyruvate dehydrogenase complex dihydrolipoamide acetyltransferase [Mesorhizobium sp.]RWB68827.1 MAG: pyruvate dehydrogenase complex dihydrolipoamide acetyltransferase [Mesorhizobium sp.]TIV78495.1 MAG: pyruvate dehydrogenase complex dihydrolipoamide acetyltransferase [Mesorhizobium sp.]
MPIEIVLPALSAGMTDAVIARWLKAEGDIVVKGELIAEIETDKATMEIEAVCDGRIGKLLVKNGARAEVNQIIAVLLGEREDAAAIALPRTGPATSPATAKPAETEPATVAAPESVGDTSTTKLDAGARRKASPLARRLAAAQGISLDRISGSGPRGRIVSIDIERAATSAATRLQAAQEASEIPPAPPQPSNGIQVGIGEYESIPHSSMRRTIARRLVEAKTTVPHFYLNLDCDIDALLALRSRINETREAVERISVNDFVIKAAAVALRKVPDANAIWTDQAMLRLSDIDISVAVATDGGLITPIIRKADEKSLGRISAEMKSLASRARESRLKPEEFQGGGFSISNLGMYGIKSFSAIVNPPQGAILAVGAGERRPVERNGELAFATLMTLTLSIDHRAVDGALGARLLGAIKAAIEEPMSLLV